MSADPWQVPDWRTYFPRGVLDPTGPRGEAIETSTDRRLLWDIESFFAVNGTTDRQREFGSVLRRYLADTCEHHWLDYEGDDDIPAHSQCLWCNDVRWSVRVVTGFEPRPETVAKAHCATCTCGRRAPVQLSRRGGTKHGITYGPHGDGTISWAEHEQAWAVYGAQYSGQSAERIAERGGFSYSELVEFLGHEPTTWRSS